MLCLFLVYMELQQPLSHLTFIRTRLSYSALSIRQPDPSYGCFHYHL